MKFVYAFMFLLCSLATRAAAGSADSEACAQASVMLHNDNIGELTAQTKDYKKTTYWKKHKRYKIGGCCVLGVGSLAALLGTGLLCSETTSDYESIKVVYGVTFTVGGALIAAASIPLFVAAHKNKKKAKEAVSLSLKCSTASAPSRYGSKRSDFLLGACLNF